MTADHVLLLNRGAHFQSDDVYIRALNATLGWLLANFPAATVVFRATPPGHDPYAAVPLTARQDVRGAESYPPATRAFHWHQFREQNALLEQVCVRVCHVGA